MTDPGCLYYPRLEQIFPMDSPCSDVCRLGMYLHIF
jgi:hypothetical protein